MKATTSMCSIMLSIISAAIEMSSYYLDILKDRLYAYKADSFERRSAQTAMYEIMLDLVVMIAPYSASRWKKYGSS